MKVEQQYKSHTGQELLECYCLHCVVTSWCGVEPQHTNTNTTIIIIDLYGATQLLFLNFLSRMIDLKYFCVRQSLEGSLKIFYLLSDISDLINQKSSLTERASLTKRPLRYLLLRTLSQKRCDVSLIQFTFKLKMTFIVYVAQL